MANFNWFEVVVKYDTAEGKKKACHLLIDALSYTEAENRAIEEMAAYCPGELDIVNIRHRKFVDVILSGENTAEFKYYQVKCNILCLDEKTGTEKKTPMLLLVQAASLKNAVQAFISYMRDSVTDYDIASVTETQIEDIHQFRTAEQ